MNKQILASVAAVALLSLTGISSAQAETSLAGGYGGLQLGYDVFHDSNIDGDVNGIEGGVFLGYNFLASDSFILGGEVGFDLSDAHKNEQFGEIKAKHTFDASLRAGYVAAENVMVYVRGGYRYAKLHLNFNDGIDPIIDEGKGFDAWTLGGGVEGIVAEHVSVRGEVTYAGYNHNSDWDIKPHQWRFNLGAAYHF